MESNITRSSRPKSRQSIAHIPSGNASIVEKENVTADVSSIQRSKAAAAQVEKKKSRSKSLGPGGLEALKESSGNTIKARPSSPMKPLSSF